MERAELSNAVASAEKSLKFLEQTIVMVEANRSKFEHIDNVRALLDASHSVHALEASIRDKRPGC